MKNKCVENLNNLWFLAVNFLFSPLKRRKKIHRYQRETVKIEISPLKIYSDF